MIHPAPSSVAGEGLFSDILCHYNKDEIKITLDKYH